MGLSERISKLFGKSGAGDTTLTADRARAQEMHGRERGQSSDEQDGTRRRMEAELDAQRAERVAGTPPAEVACPHTVLVARWDTVADMGHEDRATGYTCEVCQQQFTAAEGQALRQTEAERLRQQVLDEAQPG